MQINLKATIRKDGNGYKLCLPKTIVDMMTDDSGNPIFKLGDKIQIIVRKEPLNVIEKVNIYSYLHYTHYENNFAYI